MTNFSVGNSHATPRLIPLPNKEGQGSPETSCRPASSYQEQAEITSAHQKKRLGNAHKNARARKLWDQAAQLFYSKANSDPAAFKATSSTWEGDAVKEVAATYIRELKIRGQKNFDSVALIKAIALIEHERDFIRDTKSSAAVSRENIFPEIKDKKEALNEAITELFKAVNQADKDEALASFKNVGSGYLNTHFAITADNSVKALGAAFSKWTYSVKNPVEVLEEEIKEREEAIKEREEDIKEIERDVKLIKKTVKGGKEGVKELVETLVIEAVNAAAIKAFDALSEFVGGVPTIEAISAAIKGLGLAGTRYLDYKASENQYFNGAEELAPTVVPKMTPSTADTKDLLRASLATKNLCDANEVQTRLVESTEDGKNILAKQHGSDGSAKTSLQLRIQRDIIAKNKVIKTLKTALQDGERVLQAEQDFKNASRNAKITESSKQGLVRQAQKGASLASIIGFLCGAGPIVPAAALLIMNLIHLTYHFGGGSMADGEEKMMQMLESALKSDDLIATSQISRRQIANLYGEYSAVAKKYGEESLEELDARQNLKKALEGKINIDIVYNILQSPVSIRLENGKKLFEGQIAKNLDKAQRLEEKFSEKELTEKEETLINKTRENLKSSLADLANLSTAISDINEAMQHEDEDQREAALHSAYEQSIELLAKIENEDFHRLFTGTLKKQLGAMNKANEEYTDMTLKKNELPEAAKLKMLRVNPKLIEADATFDVVFKEDASFEIDDATMDQLFKHGAVPKALNLPISKLDGNKEFVEVSLTNAKGYYAKHERIRTRDEKFEIYKAIADDGKNRFANLLFGMPAKILAVKLSMKNTRDARHSLPDDILEGRLVLKELEEPHSPPKKLSSLSHVSAS